MGDNKIQFGQTVTARYLFIVKVKRTTPLPPIVSITPDLNNKKVALNGQMEFQIETDPKGNYDIPIVDIDQSQLTIVKPYSRETGKVTIKFTSISKTDTDFKIIEANNNDGSVKEIKFSVVSLFTALWKNYPSSKPCSYKNQCAVRVGEALRISGVSTDTYAGPYCESSFGHKPRHIVNAQALANMLKGQLGQPKIFDPSKRNRWMNNKTGIVLIRDFWERPYEIGTGRITGDHIDLWKKNEMKEAGRINYFDGAKDVWFWEID